MIVQSQYVGFQLEQEKYGIDIMNIQEITEYRNPTKMPNYPDFVEGVINLRGAVIPIINLKNKLGFQETDIKESSKIIIIHIKEQQIGFIVDEASQVMTLKDTDISPSPDLISGLGKKFIVGIAHVNEELIVLLDLLAIFSNEQLNAIEKIKVG